MAITTTTNYGLSKFADGDTGWGSPADANMDTLDAELAKPRIIFASPAVAGTTTCDLSLGRLFAFTVSQVTTLAFTNVPTSAFAVRIRLLVTNGAAFVVTFPASVTWLAGVAPRFKVAGTDEVEMVTKDGGTTWFATLRNLRPGPLYENTNLTTTSGAEVSLASYSLPANVLAVNGQSLRITMMGIAPAGGSNYHVKFGATSLLNGTLAVGANRSFKMIADLVRTGASAQVSIAVATDASPAINLHSRNAPAETLSGAVLIDFRALSITGGQTTTVDMVKVELVAVA